MFDSIREGKVKEVFDSIREGKVKEVFVSNNLAGSAIFLSASPG